MKKRILAGVIALSLVVGCALFYSANSVYDPYAQNTQQTVADGYFAPTAIKGYTKTDNYLKIDTTVKRQSVPIYIAFPDMGGFRLYSENSGVFEPAGSSVINYTEENGAVIMTGSDGTKVTFSSDDKTFNLAVANAIGETLLDINSDQLRFGFSGVELKKIKLEMPMTEEEIIYGTGERFNGFVQNGKRTVTWNLDAAYHGSDSVDAELWRGYKNVPIVHSDRGYTLFLNSYYSANLDIGYTSSDKYTLELNGPELDFYMWTGTPLENIESYTDLTGKSYLPAKWAFRYIAGAGQQYWNAASSTADSRLQNVMTQYSQLGTPDISAIYLEGVEETTTLKNTLNQLNVRYLRWNKPDPTREEIASLVPSLQADELPFVKVAANDKDSGSFIDFTHPNASAVMSAYLKNPIENFGLKGGMLDFGELIQENTLFANGKLGNVMHNEFATLYAKGYHDALSKELGNDFITFARAAAAGAQSYTGLFSGDQSADFRGLKMQLSAGLSVSSSGFSVWGADLAGFEGTPTSEVYCRGMQFATFQPLMRSHGTTSRFPWDYGTTAETVYKKSYWLRENLLNSIYSSAIDSSISGLPMMRAMAIEFPDQKNLSKVEDSYIFCENMLVAPVLEEGATTKKITFPNGKWYGLLDGTIVNGGSETTVNAPLTDIPVYLRAGAAVPVTLAQSLKLTDSMNNGTKAEALLVTPCDSTRTNTYYTGNATVNYTIASASNACTVTATAGNQATAIIAYEINAASVTVDGSALSRLDTVPTENQTGYYVNSLGQTVIRVANANWSNITIAK